MTALTIEQKKIQYSRQLYEYTEKQCKAARSRMSSTKAAPESHGHRKPHRADAEADGADEDGLRTPKAESKTTSELVLFQFVRGPDLHRTQQDSSLRDRINKAWRRL
ncbi:Product biotin synthase [Mycena indigotica]|uniref:Product biotin synthase n=1 Tax=Mycena indigotica TaxID=2126181 RepID=A0A8H6W6G4_9AGAR|nr:Product biotin synthase [Mycena indigotica]KAF7306647.1 Product biotin synthase [Mycena indigotica]